MINVAHMLMVIAMAGAVMLYIHSGTCRMYYPHSVPKWTNFVLAVASAVQLASATYVLWNITSY